MEKSTVIEKLMLFGLSRQEATIYLCLLQNGDLTGYEVAKLTGISRSNVYNGLASLAENGAAYVAEGTPTKYVAVELDEFCENFIRYLQGVHIYLNMNKPKRVETVDGYITIDGARHVCDKIHHMLEKVSQRIYFSATADFLNKWEQEITELVNNQLKVVIISDKIPEFMEKNADVKEKVIFYKKLHEEESKNQIRLIIDSELVLTGEYNEKETCTCLYSAQKNFVTVIKDAMRNEIELIQIKSNM